MGKVDPLGGKTYYIGNRVVYSTLKVSWNFCWSHMVISVAELSSLHSVAKGRIYQASFETQLYLVEKS